MKILQHDDLCVLKNTDFVTHVRGRRGDASLRSSFKILFHCPVSRSVATRQSLAVCFFTGGLIFELRLHSSKDGPWLMTEQGGTTKAWSFLPKARLL